MGVAMLPSFFQTMADLFLTNHCRIIASKAYLNGKLFYENSENGFENFSLGLYLFLKSDYQKFYKMDGQSKLGFLASEILFSNNNILANYPAEKIGLVLSNADASLQTDVNYLNTIGKDNYFPSPGLFVYTLPNIAAGEIAIRHKIKGENAFFVSEKFNGQLLYFYIQNLMHSTETEMCLGGWLNFYENNISVFLFSVEKNQNANHVFSPGLLQQLFGKTNE